MNAHFLISYLTFVLQIQFESQNLYQRVISQMNIFGEFFVGYD